ncbi:hypothetical protein M9H77_26854 [Catharanthus roseus]|uniref:Uncharacterized protein n=1 Tax=Catharanthus roseus TaxID=4058 RepID=A0ACC0ABC3_CATRO|nr:hypothetical protein M9H77_26854 [Catharanthus roseus]
MDVFVKKVQTTIRRCMVSIGGTFGCTPPQHDIQQTFPVQPSCRRPQELVPDRGAHGVKRCARRQPGRGAGDGRPPIFPVPPFPGRNGHVDPGHVEVGRGEGSGGGYPPIDPFDSLNLDIPSFSLGLTPSSQSLPSGFGTLQMPPPPGLRFRAPPPPGIAGSSTPHQPVLQPCSSDEEERTDNTDDVQHLGFGHRVGNKTMRFTPSDWP